MKNRIGILVLGLLCQLCFAQSLVRKPLHGRVTNDFIAIENGYVVNINANVRTFINAEGLFDIVAKPKDTLLFSGLAFQSKKIVLTEKDCSQVLFMVKLDLVNNQLKEVVITKELKVKAFQGGSMKYVDMQFEDDKQSTAKNSAMYSDQTIKYGTDFVRIFKDVSKLLKKKDNVQEDYVSDVAFSEYVKLNFSPKFFEKDLNLKDDEVELFLLYCSNDTHSKQYLKPEDQFQLMDFLINKSKEFKKLNDSK
ncbi:hypothetical protein OIU80_10055 [Flavobacterium sp. LS1R47]|jgi:hypothetical protein|uniref:Carboxypeptidase-like regulatory domain-containing protein n=1 Tax=Flavobacterium frigoritolerans TaxID=2987686 RepID=A0A9X2ZQ69_9FLAO|nr:hypothetical protein [Flavobacterium frigoritolerans]MCV9932627.1 hypothetical protein [Flavobacterium frigoritolerans]